MAPPQQGQLLSSTSTRTSTRGRCAGRAPRLRRREPGRPRGTAAPCRHLLLRRLGGGHGLLEVLQAELQLVGVEPLRAPPEPPALQLPDQQPQLLDLRLGRLVFGPDSIALDPQRRDRRVLPGDDFGHLPQPRQERIRTSPNIIQRQRHAAILLADKTRTPAFPLSMPCSAAAPGGVGAGATATPRAGSRAARRSAGPRPPPATASRTARPPASSCTRHRPVPS